MPEQERRVRTLEDIRGPAGRLEALLNEGEKDAAYAAIVCHPDPLGGGTMHNKVVYRAMKAFASYGLPVLRFNFRGTGLSEGSHDQGRGEVDDARSALDWLDREFHLPVLFAGFSFGSSVGMHAFCGDPRVSALIALGLPIQGAGRKYDYQFLSFCSQPKLFISGTRDQYGPRELVEAAATAAASPSKMIFIENADHFFTGRLDAMQQAIEQWLRGLPGFGQGVSH